MGTRGYREQAGRTSYELRDLGLLSAPNEAAFHDLVAVARDLLVADMALITIIDDARERQFVKAHVGLALEPDTPLEWPLAHSICRDVRDRKAELRIPDLRRDAKHRDKPIIGDQGVTSYAGTAILGPDEEAVGVLCCLSRTPRIWSRGEMDTLKRLGRMASTLVMLRACEATLKLVALERAESRR